MAYDLAAAMKDEGKIKVRRQRVPQELRVAQRHVAVAFCRERTVAGSMQSTRNRMAVILLFRSTCRLVDYWFLCASFHSLSWAKMEAAAPSLLAPEEDFPRAARMSL